MDTIRENVDFVKKSAKIHFFVLLFLIIHGSVYGIQEIYLTNDNYNHTSAKWSPDGNWIAYMKTDATNYAQIYKISSSGGPEIALTFDNCVHWNPDWSPDGFWIAYDRPDNNGYSQIYKISSSGGQEIALTSGGNLHRHVPQWSSDGGWISYHKGSNAMIKDENFRDPLQICKVSSYGGTEIQLTYDGYNHWAAQWSPDGNWLTYVKADVALYQHIYKISSYGGAEIRLTNEDNIYQCPQWSPDGGWIAYDRGTNANHVQIYKVPSSGGREIALTADNYNHYFPQWSSDGGWVVYQKSDFNELFQISKVRSLPSQEAYLTFDNYGHYRPQWSTDNKWVVYDKWDQTGYFQIYKVQSAARVPLGQYVPNAGEVETGEDWFMVYIPDKYGGSLDVDVTGNHQVELFYGQSSLGAPPYNVPEDEYGWYYIKVTGEQVSYDLETSFTQIGDATEGPNAWGWQPWNGWYWPTRDFPQPLRPSLYELAGDYTPLLNYDEVYGTTTRDWEEENHSGGEPWEGHCWGWSLASIAMEQPPETTYGGIYFNQDGMEGLYSELADQNTDEEVNPLIRFMPPRGPGLDIWAGTFQTLLAQYILKGTGNPIIKKPLQANLRATRAQYGSDPLEVWNHAIYKYTSEMKEVEGTDNELLIEIATTIRANMDAGEGNIIPPDNLYREETYVYRVKYKNDGTIDENAPEQRWISSTNYAPAWLIEVILNIFLWQSPCGITYENVNALWNP